MRFKDRIGIVTGAASKRGIGRTTALRLARDGAEVVVADLDLPGAEAVSEEIKALGRRSFAVKTDVSKQKDVSRLVQKVLDQLAGLTSLSMSRGSLSPSRC